MESNPPELNEAQEAVLIAVVDAMDIDRRVNRQQLKPPEGLSVSQVKGILQELQSKPFSFWLLSPRIISVCQEAIDRFNEIKGLRKRITDQVLVLEKLEKQIEAELRRNADSLELVRKSEIIALREVPFPDKIRHGSNLPSLPVTAVRSEPLETPNSGGGNGVAHIPVSTGPVGPAGPSPAPLSNDGKVLFGPVRRPNIVSPKLEGPGRTDVRTAPQKKEQIRYLKEEKDFFKWAWRHINGDVLDPIDIKQFRPKKDKALKLVRYLEKGELVEQQDEFRSANEKTKKEWDIKGNAFIVHLTHPKGIERIHKDNEPLTEQALNGAWTALKAFSAGMWKLGISKPVTSLLVCLGIAVAVLRYFHFRTTPIYEIIDFIQKATTIPSAQPTVKP